MSGGYLSVNLNTLAQAGAAIAAKQPGTVPPTVPLSAASVAEPKQP